MFSQLGDRKMRVMAAKGDIDTSQYPRLRIAVFVPTSAKRPPYRNQRLCAQRYAKSKATIEDGI